MNAGNFPSVSYIKMPAYQDGHAGYSDPLDEQAGMVALVNFLEQQPGWKNTAVIITWDDSDGWYDHAFARTTSASFDSRPTSSTGPASAAPARRRRASRASRSMAAAGPARACRSW